LLILYCIEISNTNANPYFVRVCKALYLELEDVPN